MILIAHSRANREAGEHVDVVGGHHGLLVEEREPPDLHPKISPAIIITNKHELNRNFQEVNEDIKLDPK